MKIWVLQGFCNCVVLAEGIGRPAAVVDAGAALDDIMALVREKSLQVEKILLTHGHYDHIESLEDLAAQTNAVVMIHPADRECLTNPALSLRPGPRKPGMPPQTEDLADGMQIKIGGLTAEVLHTPGHTPGSCCFVCQNVLLSGDTLFENNCGRWDLPGGSEAALRDSLRRLARQCADCRTVYPGHGETTSMAREIAHNPYI